MFPVLTHVFSFWIKVQTPELVPYNNMIQKFVSLSFKMQQMFQADTQVSCLLFINSTLRHLYCRNLPTPRNLCDDAIHMFYTEAKVFTDTMKCYTTITLHHLIHFGTCVWVRNMGWMTGACHTLSVAPTLFECLAPVKHCCMLHAVIAVFMFHLTMNVSWFYTLCTQKLDDVAMCVLGRNHNRTPQSNTLCRDHTEVPAYDMCLLWSVVNTVRWHEND